MSVYALIEPDLEAEPRRREARVPLILDIGLRQFGSHGVRARLVNLSSRGFMAEADTDAYPGARIWLTLPGGSRVSAVVVWAKSGLIGGEFASPVDPLAIFQAAGEAAR